MKGFISFVFVFLLIVFIASYTLFSPISKKALKAESITSKAINSREVITDAVAYSARKGWEKYNNAHDLPSCSACPPQCIAINSCKPLVCTRCFKYEDAKKKIEQSIVAEIEGITSNELFSINLSGRFSPVLIKNKSAKNGFSLSHAIAESEIKVVISDGRLKKEYKIPRGEIIDIY